MPEPSKESLERATDWLMPRITAHYRAYASQNTTQEEIFLMMAEQLALEFDAVSKERDAALIHANSGLELVRLRQQNAALVSALRETAHIIHFGRFHQWKDFEKCTDKDCERWRAVLSLYAPAEAEAKEKP